MESAGSVAAPPQVETPEPEPLPARRGLIAGLGAGIVAIGCCVGPTVAALFGVMSAATAADLADDLYAEWGWAFKIAGAVAGGAALLLARRRMRVCRTSKRSFRAFAMILAGTGIATYFALYAVTTWLGEVAT